TLDGRNNDWQACNTLSRHYGKNNIINVYQHYTEDTLNFLLTLGRRDESLYLFLQVIDNSVVYREVGSLSVHRNDHIQLATMDPSGVYHRYTIAPMQPGPANAFLVTSIDDGSRALREEPQIKAMWLPTQQGYNVEARIPLSLVSNRFAVSVTDVDNATTREPIVTIGTASTSDPAALGTLLIPSDTLRQKLAQLDVRYTRLSVIDSNGRLVAHYGDIAGAGGIWQEMLDDHPPGWLTRVLSPVFALFLPKPDAHPVDRPRDPAHITGTDIASALSGAGKVIQRPASDSGATIVSASWPLRVDGDLAGAVILEQTTNGAIVLGNRFTARVMAEAIVIALLGALAIVGFAGATSRKLRRLRTNLESATDPQGRVRNTLPALAAADEVGELSNSFARVTARLNQYNRYLEDMARQLSHELRTPVTVIRSSLDNLSMHSLDDPSRVYVERAQEGVQRLSTILTNMSEATRLEETMNPADAEFFDLADVVTGCVEGYRLAYPGHAFELSIEHDFDKLNGLPDLIAQMLDKLVANAVEFASAGTPVKIRLTHERDAVLRVINNGPTLSNKAQARMFDAMISVRKGQQEDGSHLGLGLYIARIIAEFHGGTIAAYNREDTEGVIVTVRLPIMRITATTA
ncbi:MAG TPA: ATP-binding protein, partial [Pseudomonadales bacterium]|nr:ATP-binding protein [Pseudomonadales bacterium]